MSNMRNQSVVSQHALKRRNQSDVSHRAPKNRKLIGFLREHSNEHLNDNFIELMYKPVYEFLDEPSNEPSNEPLNDLSNEPFDEHLNEPFDEPIEEPFDELSNERKYNLSEMILKNSTSNIVFSEFSAQQVLLYARSGTINETFIKLFDKLLNNNQIDYFVNMNKRLMPHNEEKKSETKLDEEKKSETKLVIANSLWILQDLVLQDQYSKEIIEIGNVYAVSDVDDAQQQINKWISDKTQNLIEKMEIDSDSGVVAINSVYFKSEWTHKFDPENTKEKNFFPNMIEINKKKFMTSTEYCRFYESDTLKILCKDYTDGYFFVAVMNSDDLEIPDVSESTLLNLIDKCENKRVDVELPKFKIKSDIDLLSTINDGSGINIKRPYDKICIDQQMRIDSIKQKIVIIVDENGTEAAVVTEMVVKPESAAFPYPGEKQFIADHPFRFAIVKNIDKHNIILFSGEIRI